MKTKTDKKSSKQLRHAPLGNEMEKPAGKLRPPKQRKNVDDEDDDDKMEGDELEEKIYLQAKDQRREVNNATSTREERWPNAGDESDSDEVILAECKPSFMHHLAPIYFFIRALIPTKSWKTETMLKIMIWLISMMDM